MVFPGIGHCEPGSVVRDFDTSFFGLTVLEENKSNSRFLGLVQGELNTVGQYSIDYQSAGHGDIQGQKNFPDIQGIIDDPAIFCPGEREISSRMCLEKSIVIILSEVYRISCTRAMAFILF